MKDARARLDTAHVAVAGGQWELEMSQESPDAGGLCSNRFPPAALNVSRLQARGLRDHFSDLRILVLDFRYFRFWIKRGPILLCG